VISPHFFIPATLLLATSCAPPVYKGGFDAPDSASKLYAIERAVHAGDASKVPDIVAQLDSEDTIVRMVAIEALRRLTGETFDYQYEVARSERNPAVERWVAYVKGDRDE